MSRLETPAGIGPARRNGSGLAILFISYGDLAGRRAAVSLLAVMLSLKMIECYRIGMPGWLSVSACSCAPRSFFSPGYPDAVYGG